MDLGCRIIVVTGMIDAAAFNHEEEALFTVARRPAESFECGLSHLVERGVDFVLISAIDLVGDIRVGEKGKHGKCQCLASSEVVECYTIRNVIKAILLGQSNDVFVVQPT